MNLFLFFKSILVLFLISTFIAINVNANNEQDPSPPAGYYVVVAAYYANGQAYAERYAATFEDQGYQGKYAFFPEKKMFLVHLDMFSDRNVALEAMRKVRRENVKEDAWVFVYKPEEINMTTESEPASTEDTKPEPDPSDQSESEPQTDPNPTPEPEQEQEPEPVPTPSPEPEPEPVPKPEPEPELNPYEGMYPVFFNLHHGTSAQLVEGQIQVIDPDKARVVSMLDANQWQYIDKPSNTHPEVQLVADIFGYRRVNHVIHLDEPEQDSTAFFVEMRNDSILIDFELVRYRTGDIFTMFNVYFFSHSAIMRPESTYELDQLVDMLDEKSNSRIRLHGHTNGNSSGDMRYRPEDDHNLFTTSGALEKTASAKALSEERANVVKRYLIDKGVREDRIEIKGWGGKRMLYKKTDPQAIKNVRVEVEILEE